MTLRYPPFEIYCHYHTPAVAPLHSLLGQGIRLILPSSDHVTVEVTTPAPAILPTLKARPLTLFGLLCSHERRKYEMGFASYCENCMAANEHRPRAPRRRHAR